eukprot:3925904-Pleurochrysis_carterae.AAC.2
MSSRGSVMLVDCQESMLFCDLPGRLHRLKPRLQTGVAHFQLSPDRANAHPCRSCLAPTSHGMHVSRTHSSV